MTDATEPALCDLAGRIAWLETCPTSRLTVADYLTLAVHRLAQGLDVNLPIAHAASPMRVHSIGWPEHGAAEQPSPPG